MEAKDDALLSSPAEAGTATPVSSTDLTTHKLTRRSFVSGGVKAAVGTTALGSFLAACGSSPSGPVTIQFAAGIDQTGEIANEVKRFNQLHQGKITVNYLQLPMVTNDQYTKVVAALRSQSATPDVIQMDVIWPAQFVPTNWLAPIDKYVNDTYLKQFWPSAVDIGRVNGKLYGIQRFLDIGMLYYRTDLIEKYGGTVPQTPDQLNALAQRIVAGEAKNGIKYGYLIAGKKIEAIVDEWLEIIWGNGGTIGNPGNLQVAGPIEVGALQYMHDLIYTSKVAPPGTNTYTPNDLLNLFTQGFAPFMRNWAFAYALANDPTKSKVAGKVGIAPVLAGSHNTGHGCVGGWVLGINAFSQHQDEAWQFIDYMLSKETQTTLSTKGGSISSRPDVVNDPAVQAQVPFFKQLPAILNGGFSRPKLTNYNRFSTPLQAAINGVLSNQGTPQSALSSVQSQVAALK